MNHSHLQIAHISGPVRIIINQMEEAMQHYFQSPPFIYTIQAIYPHIFKLQVNETKTRDHTNLLDLGMKYRVKTSFKEIKSTPNNINNPFASLF